MLFSSFVVPRIDSDHDRRISLEEFTSKSIKATLEKVTFDFSNFCQAGNFLVGWSTGGYGGGIPED